MKNLYSLILQSFSGEGKTQKNECHTEFSTLSLSKCVEVLNSTFYILNSKCSTLKLNPQSKLFALLFAFFVTLGGVWGQTFFGVSSVPADNGSQAGSTTGLAITPPASMQAGDLVIIFGNYRNNNATMAIGTTGGQTWSSSTAYNGSSTIHTRLFWCRYNGTWAANPTITSDNSGQTLVMYVFRPSSASNYWGIDVAESRTYAAAAATHTITGYSTNQNNTVSIAFWNSDDDNTWGTLSGTGWSKTSLSAQYRNQQGNDNSHTSAYNIQASPATLANVSQTQATLGNDPCSMHIISFYEIKPPTITSFTPSSECANAGSTVTITGTNFAGTTAVQFNGTNAASFSVVSSTSITAVVPSGASTGAITVTNSAGTATSPSNFTINAVPTITGSTPASRCDAGTVALGATASAGTINWYAASTGGSSLGTGTSYTTPSISSTTTYYADATSGSCTTGSRTAITATVNTSPSITSQPANQSVTTAQTATFTVTATGTSLTYQWQEFAGSSWSNITNGGAYSGATTATLSIASPSFSLNGYKYRCVVSGTCSPTATSNGNATLTVTLTYCSPTYASGGTTDNITNVTLGTLNDTPPANTTPFYFDRTSVQNSTPSLQAGSSYNLSLSFGTDANQWSRVWIDFDQDGSLETTETFSAGTNAGASGTTTISISVPSNATTGVTRMRVRGADDVAITTAQACGASGSGFGQALDYYVNITSQPACSGTPAPGNTAVDLPAVCSATNFNLSLETPLVESGYTYQWQYSLNGSTGWTNVASGGTSATCQTQLPTAANYYYRCNVTCSNSGLSATSSVILIYYDCSTYCSSNLHTAATVCISRVQVGSIDNSTSSTCALPSYSIQSATTTFYPSTNYTITVNTAATAIVSVWVDFNKNSTYEASEWVQVYTTGTSGSATISVPANATLGSTRMRVRSRGAGNPNGSTDACTTFGGGETEEYIITICDNPSITAQPSNSAICLGSSTSFGITATTPSGTGSAIYNWQYSANGTSGWASVVNGTPTGYTYSNETTATLGVATTTTTGTGSYRCVVTNGCGGSVTSSTATLTVGAAPTASAGSSQSICGNATATVSGATSSNGSIAWTENGTGSITSGATTTTPVYTPGAGESGNVTLTMTVTGTNTGCTSTTAISTNTVTVNPNPAITLTSSNPSVCQGSTSASITYSEISNSGNQFSINYDGTAETAGFVDVTDASTTSSPISMVVPVAAATGTYNGSLTVRSSSTGCSSASSYPITVTVNKVDVTMSANPQVCQQTTSANIAFTIVEGTPNEYTINFDDASFADVSSFTPFTGSSISYTSIPANAAVGTYNGTITFRNSTTGCTEANSFAVVVTESPQVSNFALSSSAVCAGFGNTITVTSSSLATGTYTVTYNVSGANTANGLTSTLNFTAGSPGTGTFTTGTMGSTGSTTLTVTQLTSGCSSNVSSGNTTTYTVNASPATPTASNSGAGTGGAVCEGSALTLSATGSSGTYTWSGPNSYATTGATPTVSSTATTAMAGTYSVYATNNGCQSQTATTTVTVNTVGITLGSNPSVCAGTTSANLTYSAVNGSPSQYSIDYASGLTDVGFTTLTSSPIVLSVPSNQSAGTYTGNLTVKNTTNGCVSNTSYPISVTVNALPTITLGSSPTVCRGASSANLTYTAQSGANEYAIDFDATAEGLGFTDVALTSLGASPVSVTTPTGATNGTYNANVTVKNTTTGCVSNNYAWTVTLTSPTVTASASPDAFCTGGGTSTITAAGADTYSWSTGASTSSISPNVSSTTTYTVTGTRTTDGCTAQATATVSVGAGSTLFSENFSTATSSSYCTGAAAQAYWNSTSTTPTTRWMTYNTNCNISGYSLVTYKTTNGGAWCSYEEGTAQSSIAYKSTSGSFSTLSKANIKLAFDYKIGGNINNYFQVAYNIAGTPATESSWVVLPTKYYNQTTTTNVEITLPTAVENLSSVYIGFKMVNEGSGTITTPGAVIDNIVVTGFALPNTPSTPTGVVTSRCTNNAVTNTFTISAVNGATSYAWAISPGAAGTISGTTTTGTVTWAAGWTGTATITAAAVNCAGTGSYSSGLSVTISAQPGVTTPTADQTVCANVAPSALSVTASGGSGTTSYQWYSNTSNSTTGGTSISGATAASYSPPASGTSGSTYYYCVISNSGTNCVNATSPATATVTVNPIPVGTSSLSTQSICSGQTTTAVSLYTSNNVTGTTFTWTRNKTTEVTGIANSGSGSSIAASTLTNTTLTAQTVVFTITPTGPASSNCPGSTYTVSIVVTPGATVNAGSNIAAGTASTPCKSVSPSAVSLTGASIGGSATDAAWSVTSGTGTLSSTVSSATPGSITYTPGSNESGTVTLTLTTNDPDGGGGCTAVSATKTIFIETPVTITTATDFVNSTTTCGQTSLNLEHDGVSGSGVWEFSASVLPDAATDASITVTAGSGTYNTNITATWNATSQCADVTKTIRFNQPVTSSISADLTSNNSWLWGGLSTTAWGTAANWYKWDGSKWLLQSSATPGSSDRVFMLNNSTAGLCISSSNAPALGTSPSIDDIKVGSGQTLSLNSNSLTINGDLINDGTINAGTGTVVFNATSGNQTIGGTQPVTLNNLTLNKNAGNLIVSTPVTINGTLTMTKGIISNSSLITLGSSSSATGTLSHTLGTITGAFRRYFANSTGTNYYFPIGNATYTRGVTVTMSQAPGVDQYITAEYKSGTPQVNGSTLGAGLPLTTSDGQLIQNYDEEGYWQIDPKQYDSGIDNATYTISLQMNNISGVNDYTKTRIIKADGPSHVSWSALTHVSAVGSNTNYTLSGSGSGFSWFNGGGDNNNNPLPVELQFPFTGACDNGIINLTWQTASEFNSSHFDVEKSRDGENWQLLTTLPSAGTSNELITYQSSDQNGTEGNNYFRLRQVDNDGAEKLYDPINVSCSEVTAGYFSSFPNPSGSAFQLILNNKELVGSCTMIISDASGKVIEQRDVEVKDGINMFVINQELTPGIYFLNISNGTKSTPVLRHAIK